MVPPSRSQAPHTGTQVSDRPPDAAASSRHEDRAEIDCEMQNSSCASGILHFPPVDGTAAFKNGADGSGADQRNGELCLESDTMKTPGPCVGTGLPGGNEQNLAEGSSAAVVRNGIHRTAEEEIGTLPHLNIRIQELFPELNNPCTAIPEHTPAASCLRPALAAEPDFRRSPSTEFVEDVNPLAGFQGPLFQLFPPLQPWAQTGFPNRHGDCSLQTTNDMSFGEGSYGSDVHIGARAPSEGGIPEALSNKRRLERGYSASISRMEEFDAGVPAFSELSTVHSDSAAVSVVNCPTNDDEGDGIGTRPPGVFQIDRHPEAYVDMESEVSCMGRSSQESAFHNNRRRTAIEFPHGVEEAVTDSRSRYGNPHGDADLPSVAPFGHMPGRWQADPVLDCFSYVSAVNQDGAAARCVRSLASPCESAKKFNESGPQHHGASAVAAQAAAIASAPYAMRYMALFDLLLHQRDLDYNSSRPREYVEKRDEQRYPLTATSAAAVASAPYAERCRILYEVLEQQAPVAEYSVSSVAHPPFRSVPPGLRNPSHEPHRGLPYGSPSPFPSAVLVDYSSDPHAPLRRKSSPFCEPPAFPLLPAAGGAFHLPAPYGPSWQPSEPSSSSATFSHSFEASQHQAQNPFGVSTAAARAPPNQDIPFLPFSATRRPL
ncbi:hypothetical protein BESB_059720 [Besnoitia besnoiti]|uniref:Uncharacterized protein n=1 Tax=Besnoitia besnoiti TaxID=94643 RepID=A0A2A9MAS5_BESBE|nr:hypothetical protein BESB_059720 [Besnoitia besnoiti]PFH35085.1 hypothetical protein BESB_059720 [Besnoitia besnoiti]